MAAKGSKSKSNFTVIWTINNFCLELVKTLRSEVFTVNSIDKTKWKLKLSVPDLNSSTLITCALQRETDESRKEDREKAICIKFRLSIMGKGKVLYSTQEVTHDFEMKLGNGGNDSYRNIQNLVKVGTVMKNIGKWVPNNALTLRCQMWIPDCNNPKTELCFAHTIMKIEKRSFFWTIRDICSFSIANKRIIQVTSYNEEPSSIALQLGLKRIGGEEVFKIEMFEVSGLKHVYCEIFNLNCEGKRSETWRNSLGNENFVQNKCELFQIFIKKEELVENQSRFLTNGALILQCDFLLSFGVVVSKIETHGPKSGDICIAIENKERCSVV